MENRLPGRSVFVGRGLTSLRLVDYGRAGGQLRPVLAGRRAAAGVQGAVLNRPDCEDCTAAKGSRWGKRECGEDSQRRG